MTCGDDDIGTSKTLLAGRVVDRSGGVVNPSNRFLDIEAFCRLPDEPNPSFECGVFGGTPGHRSSFLVWLLVFIFRFEGCWVAKRSGKAVTSKGENRRIQAVIGCKKTHDV